MIKKSSFFELDPNRNVCFVEPHPDDAVRQTGGIIAELSQCVKVSILTLSLGQMGAGTPDTRAEEAARAAKKLNAESVILDFVDTQITVDNESILRTVKVIREKMFDLIFAPYPKRGEAALYGNSAHPDHYNTGELITRALCPSNIAKIDPTTKPHRVSKLFYYLLPEGVVPDILVPISDKAMELALDAAEEYKSQNTYKGPIPFRDFLRYKRLRYHGNMGSQLPPGYNYSEGFVNASPLVMSAQMLVV